MTTLSFSHVQKKYNTFEALKDVSFSVKKGEFVALLGQNGAGKTTLINCLAGVHTRTAGNISVEGDDPEDSPQHTKQKLGIVMQEIAFDPFFTPIEILRLQRGIYGKPKNDAYLFWLLEKLSLIDKKDVRGRQLSGGMKRRLMIAKALVHEPEILILDEPTAGVDIKLRQDLWDFLQELRREKNITILLTTHYLEEAEALADRVVILHKGEIIIDDKTTNILSQKKRILEIQAKDMKWKSCEIQPGQNIADILKKHKDIGDIRIREPKLEEVFLEMTR